MQLSQTPFQICTMPNDDWYVCNRFGDQDMLDAALAAGGEIDGYDYGEMCQLLGISEFDKDCHDPDPILLNALENSQSCQAMFKRIKEQLSA